MLGRDEILGAKDLKTKDVKVPEWGGTVRVKTMTGPERGKFEEKAFVDGKTDFSTFRQRLIAMTVCDEDGKLIFTEADIAALGNKSAKALDRVFAAAQKLNGLGRDDIEDMVKNSEPIPSNDSASG